MSEADDIAAIRNAVAAYNHCEDFGEVDGMRQLFCPGARLDLGRGMTFEGDAGIDAWCQRIGPQSQSPRRIRHISTNILVDLQGDRATSHSYLQAFGVEPGAGRGAEFLVGGSYVDQFQRCDDGIWRFSSRTFSMDPAPT